MSEKARNYPNHTAQHAASVALRVAFVGAALYGGYKFTTWRYDTVDSHENRAAQMAIHDDAVCINAVQRLNPAETANFTVSSKAFTGQELLDCNSSNALTFTAGNQLYPTVKLPPISFLIEDAESNQATISQNSPNNYEQSLEIGLIAGFYGILAVGLTMPNEDPELVRARNYAQKFEPDNHN